MELNKQENWSAPPQDIKDNYINKCKLFVENDAEFANFKRDFDYTRVLEGNDKNLAIASMKYIEYMGGVEFLMNNLTKFKENDSIGNPILIDEFVASPNTLRYVSVLINLIHLMSGDTPKRVIEIGGGYGGMCKTFTSIYNVDKYTIIDLPEAQALTKKYLSNFKELDGKVDYEVNGDYDLFIADASLSECSPETQLEYVKIATKCKYAYILYNTLHIQEMHDKFKEFLSQFKGYEIHRRGAFNEDGDPVQTVLMLFFRKQG